MKIVKHGLTADDGIHITCPICNCEYVIENKKDWIINKTIWYMRESSKEVPSYTSKCPECDYSVIDQAINPNDAPGLITKYKTMFNRKDWYEMFNYSADDHTKIQLNNTKMICLVFDAQFVGRIEREVEVPTDISDDEIKELFKKHIGIPYDRNCSWEVID